MGLHGGTQHCKCCNYMASGKPGQRTFDTICECCLGDLQELQRLRVRFFMAPRWQTLTLPQILRTLISRLKAAKKTPPMKEKNQ